MRILYRHIHCNEHQVTRAEVFIRSVEVGLILMLTSVKIALALVHETFSSSSERERTAAQIIASMLGRLGPTFIKLGQALSARPDLIGDETARAFARLRNCVDPVPAKNVIKSIEKSFGLPLSDVFLWFDPEQIGTGSIAQVHRAKSICGRLVAVKVQKPFLKRTINRDFAILLGLARLLEFLPSLRAIPFVSMVQELRAAVASQLDFELEARNARELQKNFQHRQDIVVPSLLPELCNESVLTYEYIEELFPIDSSVIPLEDLRVAAKAGLHALYQMIFVDGLVHADLHPGNMFIAKSGQLVIIDFGLIALLDSRLKDKFREFFFALATNDGSVCARIVQETAQSIPTDFNIARYNKEMVALIDRYSGRAAHKFDVAAFASDLFKLLRSFSIRGSTDFTLTILSLLVYEGTLKAVDPYMDFQSESARFLLTSPARVLSNAERESVYEGLRTFWHQSLECSEQ